MSECEYLRLEVDDFIKEIILRYSETTGLKRITFITKNEKVLAAGSPALEDKIQSLQFSEQYQLIGLKGLGGSESLDSLGVIIFNRDCDLDDPNGNGLADKAKGI